MFHGLIDEVCKPLEELTSVAVAQQTNTYLGKWLIVNGTITNVKDSVTGSVDVVLGGVSDDDAIFEACCTFGETNGNEVVNYRKKDRVRIAGRIISGRVEGRRVAGSSPWQKSRIRPGPGAAEPRRLHGMAMGKRPVARQASPLWVETADLPTSDGHPFFERLNRVLEDCGFDAFVEGLCSAFYAARMGRPSLRPGRYFRMLLIGYFEGLSSERGIAWRVADSLSLRSFLDLELTESAPDHSTLSRTRRLIDVETHEAVFTWVLERLSEAGLVVGKTVGIDATTLEANAAMRSIERRDTGESYEAFIRRLAEASGVETPTRAELARFDRSRKNKKTSNKEWKSP